MGIRFIFTLFLSVSSQRLAFGKSNLIRALGFRNSRVDCLGYVGLNVIRRFGLITGGNPQRSAGEQRTRTY